MTGNTPPRSQIPPLLDSKAMSHETGPQFAVVPPSTLQAIQKANRDREQQRVREAKDRVLLNSEYRKDIEAVLQMNPRWSRRRARRLVERNMRKRSQ